MNDCFALLGQPRRPWLDPEDVKRAFVSAAGGVHPDRVHDAPEATRRAAHDRYTELNQAHLCLADARTRLRHLLELERGGKITDLQSIPDDWMELFTRLSRQLKAADQYARQLAQADSPLLRVAWFEQGEALREELQQTESWLNRQRDELDHRLRVLSEQWDAPPNGDGGARERRLAELETLYRLLSFQDRWRAQVRERLLRLTGGI
ncbi:MAG: hypothetical protein MUE94_01045 [Verrucomicrobia bacterium]|jgi:curved DNA-binding protein CbpA|nr:hypothetical protein [Verrucomicrobiota bacterium]